MSLRLTPAQILQLQQAAEAAHPLECCGLIVGRRREAGDWRASEILPAANIHADPAHAFEIDPALQFALRRRLRAAGTNDQLCLIGHYHSHPDGPSVPSRTDRTMVGEPELLWLVIGMDGGRFRSIGAWLPDEAGVGFRPVSLELVQEKP